MKKKTKIWSSKKADEVMSKRVRSKGKCERCGSTAYLQTSHFWSRVHSSVRYVDENCDCFCAKCHWEWETKKQGAYRDWKLKQLGEKAYKELERRAMSVKPRREAIMEFMENTLPTSSQKT